MSPLRAFLAMLALSTPAAAAPLIVNGGFESGDFTGWAQSGNTEYTSVFNQNYDGLSPRRGAYYALLGPAGSDGILSQTFIDAPGAALRISFWLSSDGGTPNDFSALYDGAALMRLANAAAFGWTEYTATVTGTGDDTLSFSFRDDQDYYALDDVAVRQVAAIPEPPGVMLVALGVLSLLGLYRKNRGRRAVPPGPFVFL